MDRKPAAIHVICLVAEQVEQLGVYHADEEIKGGIRIRHDEEQRSFLVSQRIQFQFVIGGDLPQLLDVKGGQPCTAGNEDAFGGLSRDKLSRTF